MQCASLPPTERIKWGSAIYEAQNKRATMMAPFELIQIHLSQTKICSIVREQLATRSSQPTGFTNWLHRTSHTDDCTHRTLIKWRSVTQWIYAADCYCCPYSYTQSHRVSRSQLSHKSTSVTWIVIKWRIDRPTTSRSKIVSIKTVVAEWRSCGAYALSTPHTHLAHSHSQRQRLDDLLERIPFRRLTSSHSLKEMEKVRKKSLCESWMHTMILCEWPLISDVKWKITFHLKVEHYGKSLSYSCCGRSAYAHGSIEPFARHLPYGKLVSQMKRQISTLECN